MSWIAADLEELPDMFFETVSEGQTDQVQVAPFPGGYDQVVSYGSFIPKTYQITSTSLDATESAAFVTFYGGHGNVTPFKFIYEDVTIYVRFDGGYVMEGTSSKGVKRSVRFGLKEKNPGEIVI